MSMLVLSSLPSLISINGHGYAAVHMIALLSAAMNAGRKHRQVHDALLVLFFQLLTRKVLEIKGIAHFCTLNDERAY